MTGITLKFPHVLQESIVLTSISQKLSIKFWLKNLDLINILIFSKFSITWVTLKFSHCVYFRAQIWK